MKIYYLLIFSIFFFASCKNKKSVDPDVKSFLGSTIVATDRLSEKIRSDYSDKTYIMLLYLPVADCAPCALEKVKMLKVCKDDFVKFKTGIVLVVQSSDKDDDVKFVLDDMKIDYPVVFDTDDQFKDKNKIVQNPLCQTFIVNKDDNKVIWVGSPIKSEKSLERYRKMMEILMKQ